jgi:hypothetical protein
MLIVELAILPIDMNVAACLHVLVGLHGAALPLPNELLGLMGGQRLIQWCPTAKVLFHKLAAAQR